MDSALIVSGTEKSIAFLTDTHHSGSGTFFMFFLLPDKDLSNKCIEHLFDF